MKLFTLLTTMYCWVVCGLAQEGRWVESDGLALMAEMNQQQARTAALNEARAEAVRIVAGVKLRAESFRVQTEVTQDQKATVSQDFFASVNRDVAYGHVVQQEILFEGAVTLITIPGQPPQVYYKVKIRARVEIDHGDPDPTFIVQVKTNKEVYKENESMTIDLQVTQDCYVYVFNLLANDSLLVLFPNRYFHENWLKAGSTLHLMPAGFTFEVNLLPGFQRAQELIYVVATKERFEFALKWRSENEDFRTTATPAFAFVELPRWLSNIPPDKRTDRVIRYEVYRPGN